MSLSFAYELELLNARFHATRDEIHRAIYYYCQLRLFNTPEEALRLGPGFVADLRELIKIEVVYEGLHVEIEFIYDGDKQIWLGRTKTGSPWDPFERMVGYIKIDQPMIHAERPVEVRLVCGWRLFTEFFREMAEFLERSFGRTGEIYRLGISQDTELLAKIYSNSELIYQNQGEILGQLKSLRLWAKSVQKEGLPMDAAAKEAIMELAKGRKSQVSLVQQLEGIIPLIPGILNYKIALNFEDTEMLARILDDIKQLIS